MAGPVTHIVLALKIISLLPATIDKQAFIVGTSFPDIRYMAKLSRDSTHIEPVTWERVIHEPNSFKAGMLFHNLVDHMRQDYFEGYFYDRFNLQQYSALYIKLFPMVLKMVEDNLLYPMNKDWPTIIRYFDTIYDEERLLCPDEVVIKRWHAGLQQYFKQKASIEDVTTLLRETGNGMQFDATQFNAQGYFTKLIQDNNLQEKLAYFYMTFENLLMNKQHYMFPSLVIYSL